MPLSNVPQEFVPGFDFRSYVIAQTDLALEQQAIEDARSRGGETYIVFAPSFNSGYDFMTEDELIGQGIEVDNISSHVPDATGLIHVDPGGRVTYHEQRTAAKTAQENDINTWPFDKWFDTFLQEKQLPYASWEIEGPDGTPHMIDSEVVIEAIKGASPQEQAQIKDMIVKIDFVNGDVNDYFKHLATALVQQYGQAF